MVSLSNLFNNSQKNKNTSSNTSTSIQNNQSSEQNTKKRIDSSISNMKDSNISLKQKIKKNDFWNNGFSKKQNNLFSLKEEIFLYTFHDKQKHKYLISLNIDCDKKDIMYTCQIVFPYKTKFMDYWIPGRTTFAIIGGTFDREVLFVGRVSEVNQRGEEIEIVGQNIGWKFKPYMTTKFQKSIKGMTVKNAVKTIFKHLGFTNGKYHIDLSGIPDIDKYTIGEDCSVERDGESIQNVPDLLTVVQNLQSSNIDQYISKKSHTEETQQVANSYEKTTKMSHIDWVQNATNYYYPSLIRKNYGVKTEYKKGDLVYDPILEKIQGNQDLDDFIIKGYSGDSEYTYEDVLYNICTAIDAHFFIIDTTVCFMSFNALIANSSRVQKENIPTIDFWQLQDESYTVDINQYGFYNTVKVKYKNGTVTKTYDDLVRVFGKMSITYEEPNLNYDGAMLKAQAYLSAHIRDFGMEVKATILHTGKITPANFVKVRNPLTMSEGLFFIQGVSIQWSADNQVLISDLDLRYGPENPDQPEIPEAGVSYSNAKQYKTKKNVSSKIEVAAQEITMGAITIDEKAEAIYQWFVDYIRYRFYWDSDHPVSSTLQKTSSNCYDTCICAYQLYTAAGVPCQFIHGTLQTGKSTYGHYWLKIKYKGRWQIADLGRGNKLGIGKYSGKLIGGRVEQKNY